MREARAKMSKAAEVMMNKASDCLELARAESDSAITQHENAERLRAAADQQNASAKRLTQLGYALQADAVNLQCGTGVHS